MQKLIKQIVKNKSNNNKDSLSKQIIDLFKKAKLKLIAFDFDETLISVHTGGVWTDSAENLAKHIRPCFKELLLELLKSNDFYVCVVSYSPQEDLIRRVLEISIKFESYILNFIFC